VQQGTGSSNGGLFYTSNDLKRIFLYYFFNESKKMPPALRLGANPPFQRVEETRGVCKKARLFAIVMAFCCIAARKLFSDAKN
jgi:hypothetical protein